MATQIFISSLTIRQVSAGIGSVAYGRDYRAGFYTDPGK